MAQNLGLECIRCGKRFGVTAYARGCDACLAQGIAANLTVTDEGATSPPDRSQLPDEPRSMWRYAPLLHAAAAEAVSLGEGLTPLVPVPELGLGALWLKDESRNPTWSFKDRLASAAVTLARKLGARVLASSSSGNAGAATAAYAARAGLPCVIVTYAAAAGPMITQMQAYGAMLLSVQESADRWRVLSALVDRFGWYPTTVYFGPAVGSNPLGIEGYKTIAFEVAEAMRWQVPDWFAVPVCYGDSLYGIWKGFEQLRALGWIDRVPRLLAAEVSGSLTQALADGTDVLPVCAGSASVATSIAAPQGTYQGLAALRASGGRSLRVRDEDILQWQAKLARLGLYAEASSVATLPAIERLRADRTIAPDETVVSLLTASGMKDSAALHGTVAAPPRIDADARSALNALRQTYGFDAER